MATHYGHDREQGWLELWHSYRIPLVLAVVVVSLAVRGVLWSRREREKVLLSPRSSSPRNEKVEERALSPPEPREAKAREKIPRSVPTKPKKSLPKRVTGQKTWKGRISPPKTQDTVLDKIQVLVFYSSMTGTTEKSAKDFLEPFNAALQESCPNKFNESQLHDLSYVDYDDYFISGPKSNETTSRKVRYFYLFLIPTYNIDTVLNTFLDHLQETHHDFRIDTASLSSLLGFSVFGFGDKEGWPTEADGFCSQARDVDKWMAKLTNRKRAFPLGMGDVKSNAQERLLEWRAGLLQVLLDIAAKGGLGEGVKGSGDPLESEDEEEQAPKVKGENPGDVEDLGQTVQQEADGADEDSEMAIDFTTPSTDKPSATAKEMVPKTSPTYAALTKQGYSIVGSHSGVKICRWTKSALRGRGSCYKFSFYGIKSHLCMEATPSLSCSNKCVFCWRHGTNPVGTTWRWQVDPPEEIFEGIKENHYKKIRMMKGVPGVRAERFAEAFRIRHCALSLVGEPIFYPHINELLSMLHKERISSFLVCNAQHPDQLAALGPVTQLYVSIDASNRESLRKIDRPLHRDFWERFQRCLDILRERRFRQRTVFRLTLVKGFNIDDEAEGYADLVQRGLPCFVEIKGVTYCGTSTAGSAGLTMQNVPFYEEICAFVRALNTALDRRGLEYGIAAEHAHSCCVLLASTRFRRDGQWHTLIDYSRFFELLEQRGGKRGEGEWDFGPDDYVGPPTPEWALWGNGGFDPADQRVDRKGRPRE